MLTLNDGRSELWQWDTGRKLKLDAECSQVHFSNKFFGRSIDVDVIDGIAIIPDILLQTDKELTAWAFVGTTENGYTKISKVFKVNKRNKPADYVFTPAEQTTLDEIMERLDRIEESQDPDAIKNAVDEYLANNPIQVEEKDPTVPDWAKEETKPSYSKSEVGLGNVDNVRQYSASNPPPYPVASVNGQTGKVQLGAADVGARPSNWMPTAAEVGALPDTYVPPNQTAAQVGADPAGTAASTVSNHNTSTDAHNDLRLELKAINDRLNAFFDSDDKTLDELSEIVAYITSNKALINSITTSKVSVSDIIDNLTTNVANKPLSAAQGVALKGLIDGLSTGKLDANKLQEAINTALAQAKESGEFDGKDGTSVTVKSVSESTADGGSNVVTFSDGKTLHVKNGKTGGKGDPGLVWRGDYNESYAYHAGDVVSWQGSSYVAFEDNGGDNQASLPTDGATSWCLLASMGSPGSNGKTPVKGTDYFTAADKAELVSAVISALPVYDGEVI